MGATTHTAERNVGAPRIVSRAVLLTVLLAVMAGLVTATGHAAPAPRAGGVNDMSCRPSPEHPNPVVMLHGLGANYVEDLNVLQGWLAARGYCTFARTYGAYPQVPIVGGLRDQSESAAENAGYIREVRSATKADKVDLVGHSEGAFQALFVAKTQDVTSQIGRVIAIAPPSHGTTFGGLYQAALSLGVRPAVDNALKTFGCVACYQLTTTGAPVAELNRGPITQPGIRYTVIASRTDELVTPTDTALIREPGVVNQYVQDFCPADPVGHIGEAYDPNVWNLVANGLEDQPNRRFPCLIGSPG